MYKLPLYPAMFKTFNCLRNALRKGMNDFCLSQGQPKIIRYIVKHPGCKLKDIADYNEVEPATVSRMVNDLEKKGMLTRNAVKGNRRAIELTATKEGEEALKIWTAHCEEIEQIALKDFTEEDKQIFQGYIQKMYKNLSGKELE